MGIDGAEHFYDAGAEAFGSEEGPGGLVECAGVEAELLDAEGLEAADGLTEQGAGGAAAAGFRDDVDVVDPAALGDPEDGDFGLDGADDVADDGVFVFGDEEDAAGVGGALGEPRGVAVENIGQDAEAFGIVRGVQVADGADEGEDVRHVGGGGGADEHLQ